MSEFLLTKIMKLPAVGEDTPNRDWIPVTVYSGVEGTNARLTGRKPYPVGEYESDKCGYCQGTGKVTCTECDGTGKTATGVGFCPKCDGTGMVECPTCHGKYESDGCISVDSNGVIRLHVDGHSIVKTPNVISTTLCNIADGLAWNEDGALTARLDGAHGLKFFGEQGFGSIGLNIDEEMFTFDEEGKLKCILKLVGQQFDYTPDEPTVITPNNTEYAFDLGNGETILSDEDVDGSMKVSFDFAEWASNTQIFNVTVGIKSGNTVLLSDNMTIDTTKKYSSITLPVHLDTEADMRLVPFIEFSASDVPKVNATMTAHLTGIGISK